MPISSFHSLDYSVHEGIARIIFDKPPLNLIDKDFTLEYHAALRAAESNQAAKVIVVSGKGKGLSGGLDIKFLENFDRDEMKEFLRLFYVETLSICRNLSKPMLTMVHGFAREGACTLAFAGDMIIAADDADFAYPAVPNLAGPPGMHVWFLQRLVGRMRAAELIFTGEPIPATEAANLGLISKAVPANQLEEESMALARKIASMSPLALKQTRALLYEFEDMSFAQVPERALEALSSAFNSDDSKEARKAFREK